MHATVAIPCYNGAAYLEETIRSVLAQSRPADEVLVIDDGSNDGSGAIAARYPVRLVTHPVNQGLSAARNTAIAECRGEILAFIDVDALADEGWLETVLDTFEDAGVSGVGGPGVEAQIHNLADRWRARHATQGYHYRQTTRVPHLFGLNMAFRRDVLEGSGGFDTSLRTNAEDMDMGYRLDGLGHKLLYRPDARVFHQRRDTLESLRTTMYRWYYWAFVVKRKNGRNPWRLALGTVRRLLWSDTLPDLLDGEMALVRLDVEMAFIKSRAILDAARTKQ